MKFAQDRVSIGRYTTEILSSLPLKWMWKAGIYTGLGFSSTAVWSRASRRQASKSQDNPDTIPDEVDFAFGFKIVVESLANDASRICIRWVKGYDSVIFESFCGMIRKKLEEAKNTH